LNPELFSKEQKETSIFANETKYFPLFDPNNKLKYFGRGVSILIEEADAIPTPPPSPTSLPTEDATSIPTSSPTWTPTVETRQPTVRASFTTLLDTTFRVPCG
jgi:hypothetical protein